MPFILQSVLLLNCNCYKNHFIYIFFLIYNKYIINIHIPFSFLFLCVIVTICGCVSKNKT